MVTTNYSIGNLTSTPSSNSTFLSDYYTDDVYSFNISNTSSINLNLHNISAGDDADLYLYADSNHNGVFDAGDQQLQYSRLSSNRDDSINYLASAGTYFARVERYAPGSSGQLDYTLDLSATQSQPYQAQTQPPNLLPTETQVNLTFPLHPTTTTFSGRVGGSNTVDTYAFSLLDLGSNYTAVSFSLTGLSSDADIRVIRDSNHNRIVDSGEVIASSNNGGITSESIPEIFSYGNTSDLFVQVYQYSGETNYQLNFTSRYGIG
jgi:hypothetical protein